MPLTRSENLSPLKNQIKGACLVPSWRKEVSGVFCKRQ
jgi:hypothetical protein